MRRAKTPYEKSMEIACRIDDLIKRYDLGEFSYSVNCECGLCTHIAKGDPHVEISVSFFKGNKLVDIFTKTEWERNFDASNFMEIFVGIINFISTEELQLKKGETE